MGFNLQLRQFISLSLSISSPIHPRNFTTLPPPSLSQSLLNRCRAIHDLKLFKSHIIVTGSTQNEILIGEFIRRCFDLGALELGFSAFDAFGVVKKSVTLQNLMIRCLSNQGLYEDLIFMYRKCRRIGFKSDNYTFPYVIKACSGLYDLKFGKEIHCVVLRSGYHSNVVVQTSLVDFYAKMGQIEIARMVFDKIPEPDIVSWNALVSGCSLNGLDYEVFQIFQKIQLQGLRPNVSTLASVIPVCTGSGYFDMGRSLHGYAVKSGFYPDDMLTPALISMYANNGDVRIARSLFDLSPVKNVVVWNSIIYAYTKNGDSQEAFEMFRDMRKSDLQPNTVTFLSVIPCCENLGRIGISHGECLHGYLSKYGLENQVSVATALISMYGKLGDLGSAEFLFNKATDKNILTWNSLISAYVHNGLSDACLATVYEMQSAGFSLDAISIINVLSACSLREDLKLGKSCHGMSIRRGFDSKVNVSNLLLAFYSDCRHLSYVLRLFEQMYIKTVVSWNTVISGCVQNVETEKAAAFIWQMQREGMKLDVVTLISILPSFSETDDLLQGMTLHCYAVKSGFSSDVSLGNALISMYSNCGDLCAAEFLFHTMIERCIVSWNSLITGYRHHKLRNRVMVLFRKMMEDGQKPNYVTLLNILPECSNLLEGKSVHACAIRTGEISKTPLVTSVMFMYARFKNMDSCFSLFQFGEKLNVSLWNGMISILVEAREAEKAFSLFCDLLHSNLKPDYVTFLSLISACVQLNNINLSNSIFGSLIKSGFVGDASISNALINLFAKCGLITTARKIFDGLFEKDAISWGVMINGYALHGEGQASVSLLFEMERSGLKLDRITYLSVLSACSHSGLVEHTKPVFCSMLAHGVEPELEHYACVIDLLGRTGRLNEAYDIVTQLPNGPSISILECLVGACRVHGNVDVGEKIGTMLVERDPENSESYVILHNLYAGAGRWKDANTVRIHMEEKRLKKVAGFSMLGNGAT